MSAPPYLALSNPPTICKAIDLLIQSYDAVSTTIRPEGLSEAQRNRGLWRLLRSVADCAGLVGWCRLL